MILIWDVKLSYFKFSLTQFMETTVGLYYFIHTVYHVAGEGYIVYRMHYFMFLRLKGSSSLGIICVSVFHTTGYVLLEATWCNQYLTHICCACIYYDYVFTFVYKLCSLVAWIQWLKVTSAGKWESDQDLVRTLQPHPEFPATSCWGGGGNI